MTMPRLLAPIWLTIAKCHVPGLVSKQSREVARPVAASVAGFLSLQRPPMNLVALGAFAHNSEAKALMSEG